MADSAHDEDFTVDRSPGQKPLRTDNRGILHMMHDELGKALGIGKGDGAGKHIINGKGTTVMDAVNEAVKGAPAPDSPASEY